MTVAAFFKVLFVALSLFAVLGYFTAPLYVPLIAHGFPPPQISVAVHMTRWLLPGIVTTSLAGVVSAMLNAQHRFTAGRGERHFGNALIKGAFLERLRETDSYRTTAARTCLKFSRSTQAQDDIQQSYYPPASTSRLATWLARIAAHFCGDAAP